jgi:hypothetical protein
MVKSPPVFAAAATLLMLCAADTASAQIAPPPNMWKHGTTVNVFAGAASASSETGALAGGAVGWEVTRIVALEGSGSWLNRREGAEAFAADLKTLVSVMAARPVVPFVEGGIGLYRASFDSSRGTLPGFYQGRMVATGSKVNRMTFTDPSFILGGGVNLFATRHLAIRPEVEAKIVRRNSQTYVVTAVSVHLAYHFDDHPITPSPSR